MYSTTMNGRLQFSLESQYYW